MKSAYGRLIMENLQRLGPEAWEGLERTLPAKREEGEWVFKAFGESCRLGREGIRLSGKACTGPKGLLISLYALHAGVKPLAREPYRAFRDFPGTMPYQGAFRSHAEQILVPHVPAIARRESEIRRAFCGIPLPREYQADAGFVLHPLPKIALGYLFYLPDEDFPASVTCLFSANAPAFLPLDALADVAEYTSKGILDLLH